MGRWGIVVGFFLLGRGVLRQVGKGIIFPKNDRFHGPPQDLGKAFIDIVNAGFYLILVEFVPEADEELTATLRHRCT